MFPEGTRLATPYLAPSSPQAHLHTPYPPGIIQANVDNDEAPEIVVAYIVPRENDDAAALVSVVDWDGKAYENIWTSPPFGYAFSGQFSIVEAHPAYAEAAFGVRNLDGDKQLDIFFTRSSFLAEGERFEAWTWEKDQFRQLAAIQRLIRFEPRGRQVDLVTDFWDLRHAKVFAYPRIYRLDARSRKYELVGEPLDETPLKTGVVQGVDESGGECYGGLDARGNADEIASSGTPRNDWGGVGPSEFPCPARPPRNAPPAPDWKDRPHPFYNSLQRPLSRIAWKG